MTRRAQDNIDRLGPLGIVGFLLIVTGPVVTGLIGNLLQTRGMF